MKMTDFFKWTGLGLIDFLPKGTETETRPHLFVLINVY